MLCRSEPGSQTDCSFAQSATLIIVGGHSCCCNGQDHRNLCLVPPCNDRDALHELPNFPVMVGLGGPARAVLLALGKRCFLWPRAALLAPHPAAPAAPRPLAIPLLLLVVVLPAPPSHLCNVCQMERLVLDELSAKPFSARLNVMKSRDCFFSDSETPCTTFYQVQLHE